MKRILIYSPFAKATLLKSLANHTHIVFAVHTVSFSGDKQYLKLRFRIPRINTVHAKSRFVILTYIIIHAFRYLIKAFGNFPIFFAISYLSTSSSIRIVIKIIFFITELIMVIFRFTAIRIYPCQFLI